MTTRQNNSAPINYVVKEVQFRMIREGAPRPHCSAPEEVVQCIRALEVFPDDGRERFILLFLDAQNYLVAWHTASVGTLSASLIHPREVFGPAMRTMGVAAVILVHNHPSGDSTPSKEDIRVTRQLLDGGKVLDIPILDHLIIGDGSDRWTSMSQSGQM